MCVMREALRLTKDGMHLMSDGMPAVLEPPTVILPRKLAKGSKSIMKVQQASRRFVHKDKINFNYGT